MKEIHAKGTGQAGWGLEDESRSLRCVARADDTREGEDALSIIRRGASDTDSGKHQRMKQCM